MNVSPSEVVSLKSVQAAMVGDISRILDQVRNYSQAVLILQEFAHVLLLYFERQDDAFYERLVERYADQAGDLKMIQFLKNDIIDLKVDFLKFMEMYTVHANSVRIRNFPKDFLAFSRRITDRIGLEKEYLFPFLTAKK